MYKNTKIITTIGPASDSKEVLRDMFNAGMNTIRMNFSHGSHEEQGRRLVWAREIAKELKKPISVLLDTKGPEIRVYEVADGKQTIKAGSTVTIKTQELIKGTSTTLCVYDSTGRYNMAKDVKTGMRILLDDGKLELVVKSVTDSEIKTTAKNTHVIKTNKRINIPGAHYTMPFISDKDRKDIIEFGVKHNVDYIAASFLNTVGQLNEIKDILKEHNAEHIHIIPKIETQQACDNLEEIVKASDGIMIARGDLGLEIPFHMVPKWQKRAIRLCRRFLKPVIVATQMLDSMEKNPMPTRAEVTDVYYAAELASSATMLSGESAAGNFPELSVKTMGLIVATGESEFDFGTTIDYARRHPRIVQGNDYLYNVAELANAGFASAVVVETDDYNLMRALGALHMGIPTIIITKDENLYTKFGITYGVYTLLKSKEFNMDKLDTVANHYSIKGDKIIVLKGQTAKTVRV